MTTYLLFKNGHQSGPFQEKQILALLRSGVIDENDMIWSEGWMDWQRLAEAFIIEKESETQTEVEEQTYEREPAMTEVGAGAYSYSASSAATQHELTDGVVLQGKAMPLSLPPLPVGMNTLPPVPASAAVTSADSMSRLHIPMSLTAVSGVPQTVEPKPIKGRMGRGGYLLAVLTMFVCDAVLAFTMARMGAELHESKVVQYMLAAAILLVPTIMRARDAGHSALWGLLPLIPIAQTLTIVYFLAQQPLELKNDKKEKARRNWRQIGYFILIVSIYIAVHFILRAMLK